MFLLVLAHPGSPGQKAVKRLCVCCVQQLKPSVIYTSKYMMGSWQAQPFSADSSLLLDSCDNYTSMCLYYTSPLLAAPYVHQHVLCRTADLLVSLLLNL